MNIKSDSAKDVRGDTETFTAFMRKLVAVPHVEVKADIDELRERKDPPSAAYLARHAAPKRVG